jgi:hypothetical protein
MVRLFGHVKDVSAPKPHTCQSEIRLEQRLSVDPNDIPRVMQTRLQIIETEYPQHTANQQQSKEVVREFIITVRMGMLCYFPALVTHSSEYDAGKANKIAKSNK